MRALFPRLVLACGLLLCLGAGPARADDAYTAGPTSPEVVWHPTLLIQNWYQNPPAEGEIWRVRRTEVGGFLESGKATFRFFLDPAKKPDFAFGHNDVSITQDMFLKYRLRDDLNVYVGQFKAPMSISALEADGDLPLTERPLAVLNIADHRERGVMLERITDNLEMQLAGLSGEGPNVNDKNNLIDIGARIMLHPNPNLQYGGSAYWGREGVAGITNNRFCLEGQWTPGHWLFQAEALQGVFGNVTRAGWYVTAGRTLRPNLEGMLRLEEFNPNVNASTTDEKDLTLGLNWTVHPPTDLIQFNYVLKSGQTLATPNDFRINFQFWIR